MALAEREVDLVIHLGDYIYEDDGAKGVREQKPTLEQVVFANVLRATEIPSAGKTGTSSDTHDTLFIAYTSKFTTLVWMGDDKKQRALGKYDAAYMTVVPLWSRYMYEASRQYPQVKIPWELPAGVKESDRGDHSKGEKGPRMDLIFRPSKQEMSKDAENRPPI